VSADSYKSIKIGIIIFLLFVIFTHEWMMTHTNLTGNYFLRVFLSFLPIPLKAEHQPEVWAILRWFVLVARISNAYKSCLLVVVMFCHV
jgi:hypothetical protein